MIGLGLALFLISILFRSRPLITQLRAALVLVLDGRANRRLLKLASMLALRFDLPDVTVVLCDLDAVVCLLESQFVFLFLDFWCRGCNCMTPLETTLPSTLDLGCVIWRYQVGFTSYELWRTLYLILVQSVLL